MDEEQNENAVDMRYELLKAVAAPEARVGFAAAVVSYQDPEDEEEVAILVVGAPGQPEWVTKSLLKRGVKAINDQDDRRQAAAIEHHVESTRQITDEEDDEE